MGWPVEAPGPFRKHLKFLYHLFGNQPDLLRKSKISAIRHPALT
jgi:hypothetical protein